MTEISEEVESKSLGMKVALNHGKLEMNSASIPIQWFFDEATITKNPTHILIVEQSRYEVESSYNGFNGNRDGCKVSEGVRFIQFLKPGYHKISVYALRDTQNTTGKLWLENFLMRAGKRNYNSSLPSKQQLADYIVRDGNFCGISAFAEIEIDVPRELFAEKPKTALGKTAWRWTNLLFEKNLRDECHYRKRALFAFTIQPILMSLAIPFVIAVALVYFVYVLLGSFFCLFFGFRPEPIKAIKDSYNDGPPPRGNLLKYQIGYRYRLWRRSTNTYMPITGFETTLVVAGIYVLDFLLGQIVYSSLVTFLLIIPTIIITSVVLGTWARRLIQYIREHLIDPQARKAREEDERRLLTEKRELEKARYQKWLHNTLLANGISKPTAYTTKERLAQRFYVGYWALKAKVCKPFAR